VSLFFSRGERRAMDWWGNDQAPPGGSVRVTQDTAPRLAPVFAAHRHIVDFMSTLPVDAYRKNDDGSRTPTALPQLLSRLDLPGGPGMVTCRRGMRLKPARA